MPRYELWYQSMFHPRRFRRDTPKVVQADTPAEAAEAFAVTGLSPGHDFYVHELPLNLYLAGPMTGHPQFNFPRFDGMADDLRACGFEIQSPAELDDPKTREAALASPDGDPGTGSANGETWGDFLSRDVKLIADGVDGVAVFHDWWTSKGARLEVYVAHQLAKPVYDASMLRDDFSLESAQLRDEHIEEGVWGCDPHPPGGLLGIAKEQAPVTSERLEQMPHLMPYLTFTDTFPKEDNLFSRESIAATFGIPKVLLAPPVENPAPCLSERPPRGRAEVRMTDAETGGEKGIKPARYDLIQPEPLDELARVYGMGAAKYADFNYLKGYDYHLSVRSMQQHINDWRMGEDYDTESELHHLAHVAWHAFTLMMFQWYGLGTDTRRWVPGMEQDS